MTCLGYHKLLSGLAEACDPSLREARAVLDSLGGTSEVLVNLTLITSL